ncbi:hypothetical protein NJ69_15800 [Pseudomonas parafulva]|nr:hypothetical protein NJ69_15800 [Pseudomonas parafulva]
MLCFFNSDAVAVIQNLNFYWATQLIIRDSDVYLISVCVQCIPDELCERVDGLSTGERLQVIWLRLHMNVF